MTSPQSPFSASLRDLPKLGGSIARLHAGLTESFRPVPSPITGRSLTRVAAMTCALIAAAGQGAAAGSSPGPAQAARAGASTISKPADGFTLAVPSGWKVVTDPSVAAVLAQADRADVTVKVRVQREKAAVDATDVMAKALVQMKSDPAVTWVTDRFDVFLDRPALFAEFEDGAGAHFKVVMVPRDFEDRSQVYYVITAGAPKASFAKLAAAFDRLIAGFAITTGAAAATTRAGSSTPSAASGSAGAARSGSRTPTPSAKTPARSTPPRGFDRDKVIERILAPTPTKQH